MRCPRGAGGRGEECVRVCMRACIVLQARAVSEPPSSIAYPAAPAPIYPAVGGILLGYLAGYAFSEDVGGWRSIYACAAPLALVLGIGMVRGGSCVCLVGIGLRGSGQGGWELREPESGVLKAG